MATWLIIGFLASLVLGALIAFNWFKVKGETAEAAHWARCSDPLIFEQPAFGKEFQEETIAQYERALALLKKHGNRLIDTDEDVYLWIHRADAEHATIDFEKWKGEKAVHRLQIKEENELKKAARAAKKYSLLEHAKLKTNGVPLEKRDFQRNENGNLE